MSSFKSILNGMVVVIALLLLISLISGMPEKISLSFTEITISKGWIIFALIVCYLDYEFHESRTGDTFYMIVSGVCFIALSPMLFSYKPSLSYFTIAFITILFYLLGTIISHCCNMIYIGYRKAVNGTQFSHFPAHSRQCIITGRTMLLFAILAWSIQFLLTIKSIIDLNTNCLWWPLVILILAIIPDALTIILSKIGPESMRKKIQKKFDLIRFSLERHEYMYQLGGLYPINGPEIPQIYKNVIHKNLEQVKERLNLGDDPNTTNSAGFSLLMQAVADGSYEIAKLLLERGANPNVINNLGRSPIFFAARYGYTNMVELLLQYNAIPNLFEYPEKNGPILISIIYEYIDILKTLLDKVELKKENGKFTEYDEALQTKNPEIIKLIAEKIRQQGEVISSTPSNLSTTH